MIPLFLILPPFFACSFPSEYEAGDDQLEAVSVSQDSQAMEDFSLSGALGVTGADADWTLTVSPPDASPLAIALHAPGRSDLSSLLGRETEALLFADWFGEHWSLALRDEAGPVYALDLGMHAEELGALFGGSLVSMGSQELSSSTDETYDWSFRSLIVSTDQGPVEVQPGEVVELQIGGASYRFVAIAAYVREPVPGAALPGCPTLDEMMSYELIRVSAPPEEELLHRPEGMGLATAGCG